MEELICKQCSKKVKRIHPDQHFCSKECKEKYILLNKEYLEKISDEHFESLMRHCFED
jgi:hypothetical protein